MAKVEGGTCLGSRGYAVACTLSHTIAAFVSLISAHFGWCTGTLAHCTSFFFFFFFLAATIAFVLYNVKTLQQGWNLEIVFPISSIARGFGIVQSPLLHCQAWSVQSSVY